MDVVSGKILSLEANLATVSVASSPACARCAAGKGCGAGIFQADRKNRTIKIQIPAELGARIGDDVDLAISDRRLLLAAYLAYGLPLSTMILAVIVYQLASPQSHDGFAAAMAIAGLLVGMATGRALLRRESICEQLRPVLRPRRHD